MVRRLGAALARLVTVALILALSAGTAAGASWQEEVAADTGAVDPAASSRAGRSEAGAYAWARPGIDFSVEQGFIPARLGSRPERRVSRTQFARAVVRLEAWRAAHGGEPAQVPGVQGRALADVPRTSIYARVIALGWMRASNGRFNGSAPVTSDEASTGIIGALHLSGSSRSFARLLRAEVPGLRRAGLSYRAAQVYTRTLGLRYNNLAGTETQEVAPGEAMRVTHVGYMLQHAAEVASWRRSSLVAYESFDLPRLNDRQRTVLRTGVRLIGWPYVWGGETEGNQPEGHGGFDCSGFVWRSVLNGGLPASALAKISARTSYEMSAIPRAQRITLARLRPGDVIFFGDSGPARRPAQNSHTGVWMGNGWFIHSSGSNDGVTISRLEGYWRDNFSWGRRVVRPA